MRRVLASLCLALGVVSLSAQELRLPNQDGSFKFAVIGDTGTGDSKQRMVAQELAKWHARFPFNTVTMLGDNIYGGDSEKDFVKKFELPYKPLLDAGVKFYAALGNHDNPNQRLYKPFNMNGERYYTFKPDKASIRFFALDSNYIDAKQLEWLDKELAASGSDWKIMFFHHPLYSSGETHGSADLQREQLEPLFVRHGVNVVLTGHEHFYERIKPQKGIAYFILGSSAKVRRGDILKTELTEKGWDQGYSFMLAEVVGNDFHFQTISEKGQTIDTGVIQRLGKTEPTPARTTQPVVTKPAPGKPDGRAPKAADPKTPSEKSPTPAPQAPEGKEQRP